MLKTKTERRKIWMAIVHKSWHLMEKGIWFVDTDIKYVKHGGNIID